VTAPTVPGARQVTLDEALASKRRDAGIARAAEGADRLDEEWKDRMYRAVVACAESNREFICDDVWRYASDADRNFAKPKALGAVVLRAAKAGVIANTGRFEKTANARRHRSPVPVWRSLTYRGRSAA